MKELKLGTNEGTNVLAIIGFAATSISQMPDGNIKSILLVILSLSGCVVLYLIKGDKKIIDESKAIDQVLAEGRNEDQSSGN